MGYPIRETADGVAVFGEKLTPIAGGLTLAGIMLHSWVRQPRRESNFRKASRGVWLTCRRRA